MYLPLRKAWRVSTALLPLFVAGCAHGASIGDVSSLPALRLPFSDPTRPMSQPLSPSLPPPGLSPAAVAGSAAELRLALVREVPHHLSWTPARAQTWIAAARAQIAQSGERIDTPQLIVVVDRNPASEALAIVVVSPGGPWQVLGGGHVSTGQTGRKDYYLTPIGVFAHTDAILDFRAEGTLNENNIRGLGVAGMRVWDFGWQWAVKGWRADGEGGAIRLQMHATDPDYLEQRLGRPASEGCVRVSSAMNRFLDRYGVLDVDYERAAVSDVAYRALLRPDRSPSRLAGRLMVVIDTRLPPDVPPTAASRPPELDAGG